MLDRSNLPFWVTIVLIVLDFSIKAVALGLVPERRRPSSGMAWLLLIFFLPGFGICCSSCSAVPSSTDGGAASRPRPG